MLSYRIHREKRTHSALELDVVHTDTQVPYVQITYTHIHMQIQKHTFCSLTLFIISDITVFILACRSASSA